MGEGHIRKEAVDRFVHGESAQSICRLLHCSTRWLRKWVNRYRSGDESWFEGKARVPLHSPTRTSSDVEQRVVEARKRLEQSRYTQVGTLAIRYELQRTGIKPPAARTIDRILHKHGLTRKHQRKYVPKGKDYPGIEADKPHEVHQMDIVGPRFITSDGRFYSVNAMDVFTGKAAINPRRQRTHLDVVGALLDTWQRMAIPIYLQMDNQLPFRGSNRHPRSFGLVIRVCLHLHIQPVFIPLSEPWRNGCVEKFQDVFDKLFFRSQRFESFQSMVEESSVFEKFHNENHRYGTRHGKTPIEIENTNPSSVRRLAESFELPQKLCIQPGRIHLIRFIRSNGMLDIFGLKFEMPREVIYEYVTATIDTEHEKLTVVHDQEVVYERDFKLAKTPMKIQW